MQEWLQCGVYFPCWCRHFCIDIYIYFTLDVSEKEASRHWPLWEQGLRKLQNICQDGQLSTWRLQLPCCLWVSCHRPCTGWTHTHTHTYPHSNRLVACICCGNLVFYAQSAGIWEYRVLYSSHDGKLQCHLTHKKCLKDKLNSRGKVILESVCLSEMTETSKQQENGMGVYAAGTKCGAQ